jgi:hypothetical protein
MRVTFCRNFELSLKVRALTTTTTTTIVIVKNIFTFDFTKTRNLIKITIILI